MHRQRQVFVMLCVAGLSIGALAQEEPKPPEPPKAKPGDLKAYDKVITKDAKSQDGVFKVHQVEGKVYFEIPAELLGRDMFWQTEVAEISPGFGYGGTAVGDRLVRFSRRENKLYLHNVDYFARARTGSGLEEAIRAASLAPIIFAWDVETEGPNKAPVIDVTKLFTTDPADFSIKGAIRGGNLDATRSYLERVKAFPNNIETRSLLTFSAVRPAGGPGGGFGQPSRLPDVSTVSAIAHYSLVLLPEKPMMGRLFDARVGYFWVDFQEYGHPDLKAKDLRYITRFRLEKKDARAAVSEPVKPIVYYLAREVPARWRPYIKKGIEDWQPAFEKAGFKNAIIAKDAPSREEDPFWDAEDSRYSVIRWAPTPTENAMGPHVHDPRSGEILSAHIIVWHNMLKLVENWYFAQASPMDARAQKLPFPDDLMGELVRYVVAHEVGHTLGLQHNMKASSSYTVAQLRDPKWTNEWGNEASIMDYGRFNYVAQPGDNARLIPKVSHYDHFAIEWGYKPLGGKDAEDEKAALDRIAARQVEDGKFRFGGGGGDPTAQSEDLSADAVEAGRLGLRNIERVMGFIIPATTSLGESYEDLNTMYGEVLGQRSQEINHVAALIGGIVTTNYHGGRGGNVFEPVSRERQKAAMQFLVENAFQVPAWLAPPEIVGRIGFSGIADRVRASQVGVLNSLLSDVRVKRMLDIELMGETYTLREMASDVLSGVWGELDATSSDASLFRRNLQRAYLDVANDRLNGLTPTTTDLRPVLIGNLTLLKAKLRGALAKTPDEVTRLHYQDSLERVDRILNPNK